MPRKTYNKLVRDRIPEIVTADNRAYGTEIMDEESYRESLLTKLVEEASEAADRIRPAHNGTRGSI